MKERELIVYKAVGECGQFWERGCDCDIEKKKLFLFEI